MALRCRREVRRHWYADGTEVIHFVIQQHARACNHDAGSVTKIERVGV